MANSAHTYEKYKNNYIQLVNTMEVKSAWKPTIERIAAALYENKERYMEVERVTNVPWKVVAVIHHLECGARFDLHLHNGDPLKVTDRNGKEVFARTRRVPRGYPKALPANGKFYTWEESAVDAVMNRMSMHLVEDWSDESVAFQLEKYNGFGYRSRRINSPYLWSGSNHYSRGKYVADGKWDSSHVSQQAGAMLLYVQLRDIEDTDTTSVPEEAVKPQPQEEGKKGGGIIHEIRDFFRWVVTLGTGWFTMESFGFTKEVLEWAKGFFSNRVVLVLLAIGSTYLVLEWLERRKK